MVFLCFNMAERLAGERFKQKMTLPSDFRQLPVALTRFAVSSLHLPRTHTRAKTANVGADKCTPSIAPHAALLPGRCKVCQPASTWRSLAGARIAVVSERF
jgi:hypothetical protein